MESKVLRSMRFLGGLIIATMFSAGLSGAPVANISNADIGSGSASGFKSFIAPSGSGVTANLNLNNYVGIDGSFVTGAYAGGTMVISIGGSNAGNATVIRSALSAEGANTGTVSSFVIYAENGGTVYVDILADTYFSSGLRSTDTTNFGTSKASYVAGSSLENTITFSGTGEIFVNITGGALLGIESLFRVEAGSIDANGMKFELNDGTVNGTKGARAFILMDQSSSESLLPKVIIGRDGFDTAYSALNSTLVLGCDSTMTFIAKDNTGDIDDAWGHLAFDVSNYNFGRLDLVIRGGNAQCFHDGAFLMYGCWLNAANYTDPLSFATSVNLRRFAGVNATVSLIDVFARADGDYLENLAINNFSEYPYYEANGLDDLSRRGLRVINQCRSTNPFAANSFADFDFRKASAGTFADRGSQVGCVLGGNGTLYVGHNTFFDYVSTTSPVAYRPEAMGLSNLAGIATGISGGLSQDITKDRSPGAFLIDSIDFTVNSPISDSIYYTYVNHGERPIVWASGQSALYFRCIADDAGSYDGGLLSPGYGVYDGELVTPGGLTSSPDGHMVVDAEGSAIFYHSPDQNYGVGIGALNIPSLLLDAAGREVFYNGDLIERPLLIGTEYDTYQKSYMFFNNDADIVNFTIVNNDILHWVPRDKRIVEPIICGGEAASWFGGFFATPIIHLSNTFVECHESMGTSGLILAVDDNFGDIAAFGFSEPVLEYNNSAIQCFNHGDAYDALRGYGRVLAFGSDLNLYNSGTTFETMDSSYLHVFRSHNLEDTEAGLPVQLILEARPEPAVFWDVTNSYVDDTHLAFQVFHLGNASYIEIGWRTFEGYYRLDEGFFPQDSYPWTPAPSGDSFSNSIENTQAAELLIISDTFAFEALDFNLLPAPSIVAGFGQPGVLYVGYGGRLRLLSQPPLTPHVYFDIPVASLSDSLQVSPAYFAEVDLPNDQARFGSNYGIQPYAIDLDFLGGLPYDIAHLFLENSPIVRIAWNNVIKPFGFAPLKSEIDGINAGQYRSLKKQKTATIDLTARNYRTNKNKKAEATRATTPITTPAVFSGSYITVGPNSTVEQLQVAGATLTDPLHLHITGDVFGYGQVNEIVTFPSGTLGEGDHGAIVLDNDGVLGMGFAAENEHSVRTWNHLGDSVVTLFPNGNCVIELNGDVEIKDLNAIVPTENFGDVPANQYHRIVFTSKVGAAVVIPEFGELNLSAFGQRGVGGVPLDADALDTQRIVFAGDARLVLKEGATLRFPNAVSEDQSVVLHMTDESRLIFESDIDQNKPAPAFLVDLEQYRAKIKGIGKIWIDGHSACEIMNNASVALRCDGDGGETPNTYIKLEVRDNGRFLIGDDERAGGDFEVGNQLNVPLSGANYGVAFTLRIQGVDALANIGRYGFLGLGAGIVSRQAQYVNAWQLVALHNVAFTEIQVLDGVFSHNQIYDGSYEGNGSLLAVGPAREHSMIIGSRSANNEKVQPIIRGGGNVVFVTSDATAPFNDLDATPDNPLNLSDYPIERSAVELDDSEDDNGRYSIMGSTELIRQKTDVPLGTAYLVVEEIPVVSDDALYGATIGFGVPRGYFQYICHETVRNQGPRRFASFGLNDGQRRAGYVIGALNDEDNIIRREERTVASIYGEPDYAVSIEEGYLRVVTVTEDEDPATFDVAHEQSAFGKNRPLGDV